MRTETSILAPSQPKLTKRQVSYYLKICSKNKKKNEPIVFASLYLALCNKKFLYCSKENHSYNLQFHKTEKSVVANECTRLPRDTSALLVPTSHSGADEARSACLLESRAHLLKKQKRVHTVGKLKENASDNPTCFHGVVTDLTLNMLEEA